MNINEYIFLFERLHPNFFEDNGIKSLPEEFVFDEMILPLSQFDPNKYSKTLADNISFGFYDGDIDSLKRAVEKVEPDWVQYFGGEQRVYCGYIDGSIASFCIIDDMGSHDVSGRKLRIGGPGCVGTLPEHRDKGIGLTTVSRATDILKAEGFDYSYIHYTYVASWYEKLGYKTIIQWNRNGVI